MAVGQWTHCELLHQYFLTILPELGVVKELANEWAFMGLPPFLLVI